MSTAAVHALIPAAGRGTRYGGDVLKQYLPVSGKAVLAHAIRAFQFHPLISSITVVLADYTGSAFESDALPTSLDLADRAGFLHQVPRNYHFPCIHSTNYSTRSLHSPNHCRQIHTSARMREH